MFLTAMGGAEVNKIESSAGEKMRYPKSMGCGLLFVATQNSNKTFVTVNLMSSQGQALQQGMTAYQDWVRGFTTMYALVKLFTGITAIALILVGCAATILRQQRKTPCRVHTCGWQP